MSATTISLPALPADLFHLLAWISSLFVAWLWLRKELTPRAVLSIFETDGVLSARQILAWIVAIYGLSMRAAGRLDNDGLNTCLEWSAFLFGIGGAVKVADRIKPATTVNTRNLRAEVNTDNLTVQKETATT